VLVRLGRQGHPIQRITDNGVLTARSARPASPQRADDADVQHEEVIILIDYEPLRADPARVHRRSRLTGG
jgi:hypothetical protein